MPDAVAASQAAIYRYDTYSWLVGVVRETLEPVDARSGRLRQAPASRQELAAVVALLREEADPLVTKVAGRLERAIDDSVAYQDRLGAELALWLAHVGEKAGALIGRAWRCRQALGLTTRDTAVGAFPVQ